MTAPTRPRPITIAPTGLRPRQPARSVQPLRPVEVARAEVGPTSTQKRWAAVAAVVVTLLSMARPALLDEPVEPTATPVPSAGSSAD